MKQRRQVDQVDLLLSLNLNRNNKNKVFESVLESFSVTTSNQINFVIIQYFKITRLRHCNDVTLQKIAKLANFLIIFKFTKLLYSINIFLTDKYFTW